MCRHAATVFFYAATLSTISLLAARAAGTRPWYCWHGRAVAVPRPAPSGNASLPFIMRAHALALAVGCNATRATVNSSDVNQSFIATLTDCLLTNECAYRLTSMRSKRAAMNDGSEVCIFNCIMLLMTGQRTSKLNTGCRADSAGCKNRQVTRTWRRAYSPLPGRSLRYCAPSKDARATW